MQRNGINAVRIPQQQLTTQLKHATAQTNPVNASCNRRFISNEGELASQIVRFTFYGRFQQAEDHTGSKHRDDGRIKRDFKCPSVPVFVPQRPSLQPPESWWQIPPTSQGSPLSFGEGQYLKHEHRRLLFAWAEQKLPRLLISMTNSPSSLFRNLQLLCFFFISCQILMSDRFLFVKPPF